MSEFGELIKKVRKEKQLTLEKVAVKVGTHKGYISGIENGKVNPPSVKFIRRIARVLRLEEKELVRIAYIDKVPSIIKKEIARTLVPPEKVPPFMIKVPLLNHTGSGYPTECDAKGNIRSLTGATALIPRPKYTIDYLMMSCDDSMESEDPICSFTKGTIFSVTRDEKPRAGDTVFVIYSRNGGKVGCLRMLQNDDNEKITLHPINAKYPDDIVDKDDVDIIYSVVGKVIPYLEAKRRLNGCCR